MKSFRFLPILALFIGILSVPARGVLTVLTDLTGNAGSPTSYGNTLTFSNSGLTVTASAWSFSLGASDNAFETAGLGQWSTGLGVNDRTEGLNSGSPQHQVDNVGVDNFVLFIFDEQVEITSVRIDPYGTWDRDVSYWVGNVTPSLNLTGKSYTDLASLGFYSQVNNNGTASDSYRDVTIAAPRLGNALLFGALVDGSGSQSQSSYQDYFKITSITAKVPPETPPIPEPTAALFGWALAAFCGTVRRRVRSRT